MVNTRIDADLSAAVQNALQTLLPHIRTEIREEFRTSSGPLDAGGNTPPAIMSKTYLSWKESKVEQEGGTTLYLSPSLFLLDLWLPKRVSKSFAVDSKPGRIDQDMFDTRVLDDEEVFVEKEVTTADPVTTIGVVVTTIGVETKAKQKMIEPKKPLKKKDQILIDEEVDRNLEAQLQAKLEEEERLADKRKKKPTYL
nr:hypothetical protein [Tanacetum cinerariifolium]